MAVDDGFILFTPLDIPLDQPEGIFLTLKNAIKAQVKLDGIKKASIQNYQTQDDVFNYAVDNIYYDVTGFENWYFGETDDDFSGRKDFVTFQKVVGPRLNSKMYDNIKKAVGPVVDDGLDAMREIDSLPADQDTPGLADRVTNDLSAYIINWQDWFYDRKEQDALDAYDDVVSEYNSIYIDGPDDYGDLSNLLDDSQYDDVSDIPYISEQ